ncbi:MFS transporter [Mycoplasmatota bacterium]|nr:MFS transporter [Mycoplasmatota bacterium]
MLTGFLAEYFSVHISSDAISIRYALIVISTISLIAVIPLSRLKPKPIVITKKLSLRELKDYFTKVNIMFLAYTSFIGLGAGLVVPFFGVYLKYMLETTESIVGLILSFAQLGTVIGGLSVPIISKHIGKYKTIVATQLLSIPLLIAIGFPQGLIIVSIAFFLRSSLMNMSQPLIRNISMQMVDDQQRSLMSAMRAMVNNLARALGIFLGGSLMSMYTYNTPYIFTILFYIIGTCIFFIIFKKEITEKHIFSSNHSSK